MEIHHKLFYLAGFKLEMIGLTPHHNAVDVIQAPVFLLIIHPTIAGSSENLPESLQVRWSVVQTPGWSPPVLHAASPPVERTRWYWRHLQVICSVKTGRSKHFPAPYSSNRWGKQIGWDLVAQARTLRDFIKSVAPLISSFLVAELGRSQSVIFYATYSLQVSWKL